MANPSPLKEASEKGFIKSLLTRIVTASCLAGVVLVVVWLGSPVTDAFFVIVGAICAVEWLSMTLGQRRWLMATLGLIYIGLAFYAGLSLMWSFGVLATLWLMVAVWAADSFAFFFGKFVKGPKMAPLISPKKTWAGFVGSIVGSIVVTTGFQFAGVIWLGGWFLPFAIGIGLMAVLGDLLESGMKRLVQVKDSSDLLPGHGGMLDRVDGLLAVLLFTWLTATIFGLTFQ